MEMTDREALNRLHDLTQDLERRLKIADSDVYPSGLYLHKGDVEKICHLTNRLYYSDEVHVSNGRF